MVDETKKSLEDIIGAFTQLKSDFKGLTEGCASQTRTNQVDFNRNIIGVVQDNDLQELIERIDALFSKVQSDFEASEDTMRVFTNIDTFISEFKDKSFKSPANNPLSNDVQDSNAKNLNELAMALEELLERINVKKEFVDNQNIYGLLDNGYEETYRFLYLLKSAVGNVIEDYLNGRKTMIDNFTISLAELNQYVKDNGKNDSIADLFESGGTAPTSQGEGSGQITIKSVEEAIKVVKEENYNKDAMDLADRLG